MTKEESREFLAREGLTGADVDLALDEGLCCPECGKQHFRSIQNEQVWLDYTDGEWTNRRKIMDAIETISLGCAVCDAHLWGDEP